MNGESKLVINENAIEDNQPEEKSCNETKTMKQIVLALLLILAMLLGCFYIQHQIYEQETQEAYLMSVIVNLLEDRLLLEYGVLPRHVGLGDLRDAWIDNPCYETIKPYYQALDKLLNEFESGTNPFESTIIGDPLPV